MRHPLDEIPRVKRPEGLHVAAWDDDTAGLFFTAYRQSFAERPGFPDPPRDVWVREVSEDARLPGRRPPGSPSTPTGCRSGSSRSPRTGSTRSGWCPRGAAGASGRTSSCGRCGRWSRPGCDQAWLAVNVDNPAHELYLRLGFEDHGVRARYTQLTAPPTA